MPNDNLSMVYVTAPSLDEARKIAKTLVEEKLIACANILAAMDSIYRWQGKLEETQEYPIILKTKSNLVSEVIEKVKTMHSYECPCIISWKIEEGNKDYLEWLRNSAE